MFEVKTSFGGHITNRKTGHKFVSLQLVTDVSEFFVQEEVVCEIFQQDFKPKRLFAWGGWLFESWTSQSFN